jgi:hypothetical protein
MTTGSVPVPGGAGRAQRQLRDGLGSRRGAVALAAIPRACRPTSSPGRRVTDAASQHTQARRRPGRRAHLIANLQGARRGHWQDHHIARPGDTPGDFTPNWIQRRDDRLRI